MDGLPIEDLWRSALAIIPVVLVVAAICRWVPCRPQTRHALWLVVVAVLVASPVVLRLPRPDVRALLDRPAPSVPAVVPSTTPPASPAPARITPTPAPRRSLAAAPAATPPTPASSPRARPAAAAPPRAVARPARASAPSSRPDARRPRPSRPAPPVAPAGPSVVAPGLVKDARQWVGQLDTARVAIMRVPAPPVLVWMGGMLTLLAIIMLRVVRSVRLVAAARPAPPDVAAMVRRGARRMRIRRLPRTVMTDRDVSPMLWCGVRAHLVLPSRLWDRLDEDGREAVVLHELAHLRRRDHWLAWMDLVLGCLYWWHPVVWWVRRRIGDEADLCCDAWVTALLPEGRRAYARALLETRRHLSVRAVPRAAPAIGLGAEAPRARRFARRLTMVMTAPTMNGRSGGPGISLRGAALAAVLAVGGCLVVPALACPPDEAQAPEPAKVHTKVRVRAPRARPAPTPRGESTYEQFMRQRERGSDRGPEGLEERLRHLEQQLDALRERLHHVPNEMTFTVPTPPTPPVPPVPPVPRVAHVPHAAHAPHAPRAIAIGPDGVVGTWQEMDLPPGVVPAPRSSIVVTGSGAGAWAAAGEADCAKVVIRPYRLDCDEKLADLNTLMSRQDVPVLVSPHDDHIEVHGNAGQQRAFELFALMIGSDEELEVRYELPEGKLDDLTTLMARDDVPILIEMHDDSIVVHGTAFEQSVFKAFVELVNPEGGGTIAIGRAVPDEHSIEALAHEYAERASEGVARYGEAIARYEAVRAAMSRHLREAEKLEAKAEALEERADEVEEAADELEDEADDLENEHRARKLYEKAREMYRRAEELYRESEELEARAEEMEMRAEELEEQSENIEELLEELAEARAEGRGSSGVR